MRVQRITPVYELLARWIFLILPTACAAYFLLENASAYYGIIGDPGTGFFTKLAPVTDMTLRLTLFFGTGAFLSSFFHSFRFRFLPPFAILLALLWLIHRRLDHMASGEFDAFFISVQFAVFTVLFISGWISGWGFMRWRYWPLLTGIFVLSTAVVLIAGTETKTVTLLLQRFVPALLYAVYLVFTAEQIRSYREGSRHFWWFLSRRLFIFSLLSLVLAGTVVWSLEKEIRETVASYGGKGEAGSNSMLEKKPDGSFDLKHYSRLRGHLGRNNELLFCAHIDHFLPDTDIPNPLYLTAFHYTLFDTLTETFERDSLIPYNDLFEPDPSKIPLFSTRMDSSVIKNSLGDRLRTVVEMELYNKSLSPETYLAPGTGFFIQPVTVEKDFRDQFKTAYRTKSYVSALNSAYFIYNSDDEAIQAFQQQRFDVLRKITGYEGMDPDFMEYYTRMPENPKFDQIRTLAKDITASAGTPVDQVLAIRDFFLSTDENGEPLFRYSDNPGIPDIPSASKLMYFLFENKKGYCAYYAGATLFLLRALGIPSRITVGFLTVDRSDKNKGWYWYYADQAHAWVQVYFPGYGWLDFDTTVGNDDAQESPAPDGTPPLQPPKAWLAMTGIISSVDTLKQTATLLSQQLVFHDREYPLAAPATVDLDLKIAAIRLDSLDIPLKEVMPGDTATAISYAEAFKRLVPRKENGTALIQRFPAPAPIDEVYLKRKKATQTEEAPVPAKEQETFSVRAWLPPFLWAAAAIIAIIFLTPAFVYLYFRLCYRYAKPARKPYHAWRVISFYLHQLGIPRNTLTPLQYAIQVTDPQLDIQLTGFMQLYLKQKYAEEALPAHELDRMNSFLPLFFEKMRQQYTRFERLKAFLQILRTVSFFVEPEASEK